MPRSIEIKNALKRAGKAKGQLKLQFKKPKVNGEFELYTSLNN